MLCGMTLVRSVNRGEFDWVSDEEHRLENFSTHTTSTWRTESATYNAVEDKVLVALFSEDLHRPAPHIPNSLGCASLRSHSGDTHKNFGLFANPIEESSRSDIRIVVSYFKFAPCTNGRSMHGTLGNALPTEVGQSLDELGVLHQHQALNGATAQTLGGRSIRDRASYTGQQP